MAGKWTWAVYGPKTIGIGRSGDSGASYMVHTRNVPSNHSSVASDMRVMCAALNKTKSAAEQNKVR